MICQSFSEKCISIKHESHHTMLPSGDVHILAQSGMGDGLEDLKASQDLDGVGGERKTIAATHIVRKRRGEEGGGPQLRISEGLHDSPDAQQTH